MSDEIRNAAIIPLRGTPTVPSPAADAAADLVAFLFTDIEGSSLRWLNHRAAMQDAMRLHDQLVKDAIATHGGEIFKTTGDGFHAAFQRPSNALSAAVTAQQALAAHDWSSVGGLTVRMSVHVGTAERRDGDYFGPAANRVSRLLALGHGGQILITSSAAELIVAERESRYTLGLLGAHPLDDPLQPVDVYQVEAPGLAHDFPPLRTTENRPTNMPSQLASLIGREAESEYLHALLGTRRLVTLTGAGGVGKTRVMLDVGAKLLDRFGEGAWLVELAAIADPTMVPSAVMTALRISVSSNHNPQDALISRIKGQELLLLLDNCEHLIDAVAKLVKAIMAAAPKVRVLASSQEPLGIAGEEVFRLPSLAMPDAGEISVREALNAGAVQLFVERAKAADRRFVLHDKSVPTVVAICRRLDGIPLAIEMAAARASLLGVDKLAQKLDERFRVLTQGDRTALPRQQTLRAALDWSYGLLSDRERTVLRRLSVFSGGFTLEGATTIVADEAIDEFEVIDLLSHLVARSLVAADSADDGTRYRLPETMRAYALEKLVEAGEVDTFKRRQANFFRALFDRSYDDWLLLSDQDWRAAYVPERDNLRSALDWALGPGGDPETAVALAGSAGRLFYRLALFSEARQRLAAILPFITSETPPAVAARFWMTEGIMWRAGDIARSVEAYERAVALYRTVNDPTALGETLCFLAHILSIAGRRGAAQSAVDEAGRLLEGSNRARLVARYFLSSGVVALMLGDSAIAFTHSTKAKTLFQSAGAEHEALVAFNNVGVAGWGLGDLDGAIAVLHEGIERARQLPFETEGIIGFLWGHLAGVLTERGDLAEALNAARKALPLLRVEGTHWAFFDPLALRVARIGRIKHAAQLAGYAEALFVAQSRDTTSPRVPGQARARARLLELLHAKLNPDDLARMLAAGAKLSDDEACRIALEN